jgi:DNA-binding transcriptional regulator YiaG
MAVKMNNHVFKGHKTLLGTRYVTYAEVELPLRYDIFPKSSSGFDWGHNGSAPLQLAFSILYQLSDKEFAEKYALKFTQEIIIKLNSRDWILSAIDVIEWISTHDERVKESQPVLAPPSQPTTTTTVKKVRKKKVNVVKSVCLELGITQKNLAEILEVPEGTVSSWAVKNEIPRLGKKAIEFYKINTRNQKIVDSYKDFMHLLQAS